MIAYKKEFISYALSNGVLKFGGFTLKSGRTSPYFFNTGLFNSGASLTKLGHFYALALQASELRPDVLYGPAYKGIPLVCATAMAYANLAASDLAFAFNRKEAKDHGEGGQLVGAPLHGQVIIIDDVITAGISIRESVAIIKKAGAEPIGVLIALDRQEQGQNQTSAIRELVDEFGLAIVPIITLADILAYLAENQPEQVAAIKAYQSLYGLENGNF